MSTRNQKGKCEKSNRYLAQITERLQPGASQPEVPPASRIWTPDTEGNPRLEGQHHFGLIKDERLVK